MKSEKSREQLARGLKPLAALCFLLVLLPRTKTAQERIPDGQLRHFVQVTVKLIQVHVTDKKGNPITDLKREDFSLWVDGNKVDITDFERHVLTENLVPTEIEKGRSISLPSSSQMAGRRFLLFFDFSYNSARGIRYSWEAALKFLSENVGPTDEVAVVSYSVSRGLRIHEFFSLEHDRIRECVRRFRLGDVVDRATDVENQYLEFLRSQGEQGTMVRGMEAISYDEIKRDRNESRAAARQFIARTKELFQGLRYIPGKKYILLFSSGMPSSLIYGIQAAGRQDDLAERMRDLGVRMPSGTPAVGPAFDAQLRDEYEGLLKEMAAVNIVVFPFDAHDFDLREAPVSGAYSLERMAKQTGGRYFGDITASGNLDYIQRQTQAYYVLGFPIREAWDARFHKVRVEVSRPGCKVYSQAGYFSPKSFKDLTSFEKALHLVDLALSPKPLYQDPRQMPLKVYAAPLTEKDSLLFLAELPMKGLRDRNIENVEIVDLVFNTAGNVVVLKGGRTKIGATEDSGVYYWSVRDAPPGDYECRTVVRDLETGSAALGAAQARIGDTEKPRRFYPPLFLFPAANPEYLSTPARRGEDPAQASGPIQFFLPDNIKCRPLLGPLPDDAARLFASCPYRWDSTAAPNFRAFFTIPAEIGDVPEKLSVEYDHHRLASGGILIFEVPLAAIRQNKPVTLHIEDPSSGFEFSSRISLQAIRKPGA
jgi:VWFA-related protein